MLPTKSPKKDITLYGIIALCAINMVMCFFILNKNIDISILKKENQELQKNISYYSLKNDHYKKTLAFLQKNEIPNISHKIELSNESGDRFSLNRLISNDKKLVFRYSELGCNVCVDSQLVFINKFIQKYGSDRFIMIANYSNLRNLNNFKKLNSIDYEIYNCREISEFFDRTNMPYYFILDGSFNPKMFFFPDKLFVEDTKEYFEKIEKIFQ